MDKEKVNIFWFRRDLRLEDNAGLYHALKAGLPVIPLFIFDKHILDKLPKNDHRVTAIYSLVESLKKQLENMGSTLFVFYDYPDHAFEKISAQWNIQHVFTNNDYEPYAMQRDDIVRKLLKQKHIGFTSFKDHVIYEKSEIQKSDGKPYHVFTPYSLKWKERLKTDGLAHFSSQMYWHHFMTTGRTYIPPLSEMGFVKNRMKIPSSQINEPLIQKYHLTREFPGKTGTSRLGFHLRFGSISIRKLVLIALGNNEIFLNELIWREFYSMILWHYPHVCHRAFNKKFEFINWQQDEEAFEKWKTGNTGIPIVDAGMHELNETGHMHNRARMIVAGFLTKNLLIDWRWGEAYFAEKLLDYELASNNGGWQWAAGTGVDAAPYFRIFNPLTQAEKFDPQGKYVNKWLKNRKVIPEPMIDLKESRARAIEVFRNIRSEKTVF